MLPKFSVLAPILDSLHLSPGANLGNNEVAAALLALRNKGKITVADLNAKLVVLGVATTAGAVVTPNADITRIQGVLTRLAAYTGTVPANLPQAIDRNGNVTTAFLNFYLKQQVLNWPAGTGLPANIKNTPAVINDVNSILKTHPAYQRTQNLFNQFVSISGATRTFDYKSLVKMVVQRLDARLDAEDRLSDIEYNYFKAQIPTTAYKTTVNTIDARNNEITALEKAARFVTDILNDASVADKIATIRTRFDDLAGAAGDNSVIDFNGDTRTGADDNMPAGSVPFTDRNILNGVLSALGLGSI